MPSLLKYETIKKYFSSFENIIFIFFLVFTSIIYIHNLARDVYGGDVGDFVVAAFVGGVPHPSGYPLFTFFGYILSHTPFPFSIVARVGLISVVSSVGTLIVFYKLAKKFSGHFVIALLSTSILAYSYLFWLYTEIPEVFSLNNFFMILIFYFAIRFYETKKSIFCYLTAFFCSLAFFHHQFIILIFPSVLVIIEKNLRSFIWEQKRRVLLLLGCLILGFAPYLYVVIAASHHPAINWDGASNLANLIHLVLRKDYSLAPGKLPFLVRIFTVRNFFITLNYSISTPVIILSFIGAFAFFVKHKRIFFAYLLALFLTVVVFEMYAEVLLINDFGKGVIERFQVLPSIIFLFFLPSGFAFIYNLINRVLSKKIYAIFILLDFFIIPIVLFHNNMPVTNVSKTHLGENYGKDVLNPIEKNAVIILYGADTVIFNSWYAYYIEGIRNDLHIIDSTTADNTFLEKQAKKYEEVKKRIKSGVIVAGILPEIKKSFPVYSTFPLPQAPNFLWIPMGLTYKLISKNEIPSKREYLTETKKIWDSLHVPKRDSLSPSEKNFIVSGIITHYSDALLNTGDFIYTQYHDINTAMDFYKRAVQTDSDYVLPYERLGITYYNFFRNCKDSAYNLEQALSHNESRKEDYTYLYLIYQKCEPRSQKISNLESTYSEVFHENLEKNVQKFLDSEKKSKSKKNSQ